MTVSNSQKKFLTCLAPLLIAAVPLGALGATPAAPAATAAHAAPTPLVDKVRRATARFLDLNVAIAENFVAATPCVSGPDHGAMGVHFVLLDRLLKATTLSADQPTALIYEPQSNGAMRFVGVEFIMLKSNWESNPKNSGTPALDGNLLNLVGEPNRYGLPAFYEMHVWAWEHNAQGSYADWNNGVTCEHQPDSN